MSAITSNRKGSNKRGHKDSQLVDKEHNVLCVLQKHCTDAELRYLVVQQEKWLFQACTQHMTHTNRARC